MVSEVTRFYCQPDKTSSSILRQAAFQRIFHDVFWKSYQEFLIALHSHFLSQMHGFRDNEVLFQTGYDVIVISSPGGASGDFHDGFWTSEHDFLIVIHNNVLAAMLGFRDHEVLLQAGYDVIVTSSPGGASGDVYDGLWKSDHDFPIAFLSNFLSRMHGFRDNEV